MVTKYIEWIPMEPRGWFCTRDTTRRSCYWIKVTRVTRALSEDVLPNGNEMVVTDNIFCLVMDADGNLQPAVIDMKVSST